MKKFICALLVACVIATFPLHTGAVVRHSQQKKDKKKAASFVKFIPGIPQLKSKKYVKGTLLLSLFIGFAAGSFVYNSNGNKWYDKYQGSVNVEEIVLFRSKAERSFKNRNLCLIGIASVWLFHILDLKFTKSGNAGLRGDIDQKGFDIGFYFSF